MVEVGDKHWVWDISGGVETDRQAVVLTSEGPQWRWRASKSCIMLEGCNVVVEGW